VSSNLTPSTTFYRVFRARAELGLGAFDSKAAAKDWAESTERELRGLRERGGARADITKLTISDLVVACLKDSKVKLLRSFDDLSLMLARWVDECGAQKIRSFGYLQIVAYRDKLLSKTLTPAASIATCPPCANAGTGDRRTTCRPCFRKR
jgi:hypothetical protein